MGSNVLESLNFELQQLCIEIKSEKTCNRNKAIERFGEILSTRKAELLKLQSVTISTISWTTMFNSLMEGIIQQSLKIEESQQIKNKQKLRNKNALFCSVITKIIEYANEENRAIKSSIILEAILTAFQNKIILKSFCSLFLRMLEYNLLGSKKYIQDIKMQEYNKLLQFCFQLYGKFDYGISHNVLRCIHKILYYGIKYTHLATSLLKYIQQFQNICLTYEDQRLQPEIIKIAHSFTKNLCIDFHGIICHFVQTILPCILNIYDQNMRPDIKKTFFDLCHISIIIHYPNLSSLNFTPLAQFTNKTEWNRGLLKLTTIIEKELKERSLQINQSIGNELTENFLHLAAVVFVLIYWNSTESQNEELEPKLKLRKKSEKLEKLMEHVNPTNQIINWKWFFLLSTMLKIFPEIIEAHGYQSFLINLLKIAELVNIQSHFENLRFCCEQLLNRERDAGFKFVSEASDSNKLWDKLFHKISIDSFKNDLLSFEKQKILQLLISFEKVTSIELIISFLNSLIASQNRTNENLITVQIIIKKHGNVVSELPEVIKGIMTWLYPNTSSLLTKEAIKHTNVNPLILAETTITLIVKSLVYNKSVNEIKRSDLRFVNVTNGILFKYLKMVVYVENVQKNSPKEPAPYHKKTNGINEVFLENFISSFGFEPEGLNNADVLVNLEKLSVLSVISRRLIELNSIEMEKMSTFSLFKKLILILHQIELQIGTIDVENIQLAELVEILQSLEIIFICFANMDMPKAFKTTNLRNTIQFITSCIGHSNKLKDFNDDTSIHETVQLLSLKCLAIYDSQGLNATKEFEIFEAHYYNLKNSFDVECIFELIKVITRQELSRKRADWVIQCLKELCHHFHKDKDISFQIVSIIPNLTNTFFQFTEFVDDICVIISSFLKKCYKKMYSIDFTCTLLFILKSIAKSQPNTFKNSNFVQIYLSLGKFILSESIVIQFATVECLGTILDEKHILDMDEIPFQLLGLSRHLFDSLQLERLQFEEFSNEDHKQNMIAITLQTLWSVFGASFALRKECMLNLLNFVYKHKLEEEKNMINANIIKISKLFECSIEQLTKYIVDDVISFYLQTSTSYKDFPWFIISESPQKFIETYKDNLLFLAMINTNCDISNLTLTLGIPNLKSAINLVLDRCYGFTLPYLTKCYDLNNIEYTNKVHQILNHLKFTSTDFVWNDNRKNLWKILYHLTLNYWDKDKFCYYCYFVFQLESNKFINYQNYSKSIKCFLNEQFKNSENAFGYWVLNYTNDVIILMTKFKKNFVSSFFIEEKVICYFYYCTIADLVLEELTKNAYNSITNSCKEYFVREVLFFHINILSAGESDSVIKRITSFSMNLFCQKFLNLFGEVISKYLPEIVHSLITSFSKSKLCSFTKKQILSILKFLVIDNSNQFSKSIAKLDPFPSTEDFLQMNEIRNKYKENVYGKSLLDEINYFFDVTNRTEEGYGNLSFLISLHQKELGELLENENEEPKQFILNKLIMALLEGLKSDNKYISIQSANCLAQIGPVKLSTIVLSPNVDATCYKLIETSEKCLSFLIKVVIQLLDVLSFSQNILISSLANEIAYNIINSCYGYIFKDSCSVLNALKTSENNTHCTFILKTPDHQLDFINLLKSTNQTSYEKWIKEFTSKMFTCFGNKFLSDFALIEQNFAESTLIILFKVFLSQETGVHLLPISQFVNYFFENTIHENKKDLRTEDNIYTKKRILKYFLDIAECVRLYNQSGIKKVSLNYLTIAEACNYCEAYFVAILYLELWALFEKEVQNALNRDTLSNEVFQNVAKIAFNSIGCFDATLGFLNPITSRLEYLDLQNDWSTILLECDASLKDHNQHDLSRILQKNGFFNLSACTNLGNHNNYEVFWRLGKWNVCSTMASQDIKKGNTKNCVEKTFQLHHFNILKALAKKEDQTVLCELEEAKKIVVNILKSVSSECTPNVYKYLTWLRLLQQAEDFQKIQFSKPQTDVESIFKMWHIQDSLPYGRFEDKEVVISQRINLIENAGIRAQRKIKDYYKDNKIEAHLRLNLINDCKANGNVNLRIKNIAHLKIMDLPCNTKIKVLLEDAAMQWDYGNNTIAKAILHHIVTQEEFGLYLQKVDALRIYGKYLAETNSESFEKINDKYFNASLNLLEKFSRRKNELAQINSEYIQFEKFDEFYYDSCKNIFANVAQYADREFCQIDSYIKSESFQIKMKLMMQAREAAISIKRSKISDRDKASTFNILMKNSGIDDGEIKFAELKHSEYLCIAVENYMKFSELDASIKSSEIFRIIALWFGNKGNLTLQKIVQAQVPKIPTFKFITVLNQVTARLGYKELDFDNIISSLLGRCAIDHPYHTLPHIFALVNANIDGKKKDVQDTRCLLSKVLLTKVLNESKYAKCAAQMEKMYIALIEFANKEFSNNKNLALTENMKKLKNLDSVNCPTLEIPVSIDLNYEIISIIKWKEHATSVGGINAPKKIICICSDGVERPQLLKGKDDLRQDAVMQQALSIVNDLLSKEKDTFFRKLNIRTYKVVPLSKRSGILHWCRNTIPLGVYLSGLNKHGGAHKKYRPNDYTSAKCRKLMMEHLKETPEQRLQVFLHICQHIKPVFQHFFFENFIIPGIWFERRLAYMNSVATTSIVGYVLGLGDRHVQNILIDQVTAEVIHIDFGIAFEQGKVMPTPETVPFRLTRDTVAPMGICSTEGIFKKSCERTMKILRDNQLIILTILEVLLYDPLYAWTYEAKKAQEKQFDNMEADNICNQNEEKNATAQRALIRIKSKLNGFDGGGVGVSSIEAQVQKLIIQATNKENLSRMYPGWDPYL